MAASMAPPTPESLAALLQQLTTPDTTQLRLAERTLTSLQTFPTILPPLSQVLTSHPTAAIRHLSAVILRRILPQHWPNLHQPARTSIKSTLLPSLTSDPSAAARRGILSLLATIARIEDTIPPDLLALSITLATSSSPAHRALSHNIIHSLSDALPIHLVSHLPSHIPLLASGLSDPDLTVRLAALHAFEATLGPASVSDTPAFDALAALVPRVVAVAADFPNPAEDNFARAACAVFDVLTLVLEIPAAPNAKAYFSAAVEFALRLLANRDAAASARSAATEFVVGAVSAKPKTLRKNGQALDGVRVACGVVFENRAFAACPRDFGHDEDDPDEEEVAAIQLSLRLLDSFARRPELSRLVFAEVMSVASRTFERVVGMQPSERDPNLAAAYRVIGAVCQGCSVEVTAHAQEVVKRLVEGAMQADAGFATRARAIEAIGLACDALDADEMPDEVTAEVANAALSALLAGMRDPELFVRKHACMALEPVITLMTDDTANLQARVAEIIQALGGLGVDAAVEAVMAVAVLAEHAIEVFSSSAMYKDVVEGIVHLMGQNAEADMMAKVAALEAAGALVSACKDESVIERLASNAVSCLEVDDPTCKQATYSFFARMADAVGGSVVAVFGVKVLTAAIESMTRQDVVFLKDEDEEDGSAFANGLGDEEDEEDISRGTFQVRTAFLDEKMVATACVGAFASATFTETYVEKISASIQTALAIRDLFAQSVPIIDDLTSYFHEDVRAAAHRAHSRMAGANAALIGKHPSLAFAGSEFVHNGFSRLIYGMKEDDDIWVVTNVVGSTSTFLGLVPPDVLHQHKASLLEGLEMLIAGEATCQLTDEDDSVDGGADEDADGDEIGALIEAVGDVIEAIVHSLRGYFAQDFPQLLKKLLDRLYTKTGSPRNRGMVLGAVTGVLLFLNWERCSGFSPPAQGSPEYELAHSVTDDACAILLAPALTAIRSNESKTLQRNAVFLTGVIFARVRASKSEVWALLPQALGLFQEILSAGKSSDGALVDNAAGAVARILTARGAPAGALGDKKIMLQAILNTIPLEDDPSENTTIARTLVEIAQSRFEDIVQESALHSVVSCLVSAALIYREAQIMKKRRLRHDVTDTDANDLMTSLSEEEMFALVAILARIRQTSGDSWFEKLQLSSDDEQALQEIMQINSR